MDTTPATIADPLAIVRGLHADAIEDRLRQLAAEMDALRLLLRAAVRAERGTPRHAERGPAHA